jgi:hypothetical protein
MNRQICYFRKNKIITDYSYMVLALVFERLKDFLSYRTAAARP